MRRKGLFVVLVAIVITLGVLAGLQISGVAQAQPPSQTPALTIPYPGRLSGEDGQPVVDGAYDFTFALYDAEMEGTRLWSEVQEGVAVQDGGFVTTLGQVQPIPAAAMEGGARWLEVSVRGPEAAAFSVLSPRQQLKAAEPAPQAGINAASPCPHDHLGEVWTDSIGNQIKFTGTFVTLEVQADSWGGIWGASDSNIGVMGSSRTSAGVHGESENWHGGVFETNSDGYMHGDVALAGDVGHLIAHSSTNSELKLSGRGDVTVHMDIDANGSNNFNIKNGMDFSVCWVDEAGNLTCSGTKSAVVDTAGYGRRKLYAVESPEVWHEDLGRATLVNGEVTIVFEPIFAQTANLEEDYHVFLTALGQEPVLLYVSDMTPDGFTVRGSTLDGQPAVCSFDYRVMAKRLGYEDVRLAPPAPSTEGGE